MRKPDSVNADVLLTKVIFIISVIALVLFGLVMVFSASSVESIRMNQGPFLFLQKQAIFAVAGTVAAFLIWRVAPFSFWKSNLIWWLFVGVFALTLLTLIAGTDIYGARRWLYIGSTGIQPSEFAKIVLILVVAKIYYEYKTGIISLSRFLLLLTVSAGLMLFFIYKAQSDLGTTVICAIGIISVLWLGGAPKKIIASILVLCVVTILVSIFSTEYRMQRFSYFLDPYNDGEGGYGKGYQIIRSRYALAEGGVFGVGLGNSHEKFQYLPEAETDFIFAIIAEELGLVGALFTALLFVVFLISGLYLSKHSGSLFGAMISGAFVIMLVFQAFLNIFCVVGLFPTTGKPLPFISSGGSSLLATLIMVGFVLAASEEKPEPTVYEKRRNDFQILKSINFGRVFAGAKKDTKKVIDSITTGTQDILNTEKSVQDMPSIKKDKSINTSKKKTKQPNINNKKTKQVKPNIKKNAQVTSKNKKSTQFTTSKKTGSQSRRNKVNTRKLSQEKYNSKKNNAKYNRPSVKTNKKVVISQSDFLDKNSKNNQNRRRAGDMFKRPSVSTNNRNSSYRPSVKNSKRSKISNNRFNNKKTQSVRPNVTTYKPRSEKNMQNRPKVK